MFQSHSECYRGKFTGTVHVGDIKRYIGLVNLVWFNPMYVPFHILSSVMHYDDLNRGISVFLVPCFCQRTQSCLCKHTDSYHLGNDFDDFVSNLGFVQHHLKCSQNHGGALGFDIWH